MSRAAGCRWFVGSEKYVYRWAFGLENRTRRCGVVRRQVKARVALLRCQSRPSRCSRCTSTRKVPTLKKRREEKEENEADPHTKQAFLVPSLFSSYLNNIHMCKRWSFPIHPRHARILAGGCWRARDSLAPSLEMSWKWDRPWKHSDDRTHKVSKETDHLSCFSYIFHRTKNEERVTFQSLATFLKRWIFVGNGVQFYWCNDSDSISVSNVSEMKRKETERFRFLRSSDVQRHEPWLLPPLFTSFSISFSFFFFLNSPTS